MPKKKSKSYQVLPNMQIYLRSDSPRYYGCLRIDGKYFRKCLQTENKSEAERKLFEWKGEMLSSVDSPLGETGNSFSAHASRLIKKRKDYLHVQVVLSNGLTQIDCLEEQTVF